MQDMLCNSRWHKSEFSGDVCHNRQPYDNCRGSAYEKLINVAKWPGKISVAVTGNSHSTCANFAAWATVLSGL